MSSTRLPGKVMLPFAGSTIIECTYRRLERSIRTDKVIVATSTDISDDPLAQLLKQKNLNYFRGSLEDVLKRFITICNQFNPQFVVRITGDCPLVDPKIVDACIEEATSKNYDYCRVLEPYPDGLDVEVFKCSALQVAHLHSKKFSEREHLGQYFLNHSSKFMIGGITLFEDKYQDIRLTLDEQCDYDLFLELDKHIESLEHISSPELLSYILSHKSLLKINSQIQRNAGLIKSISQDKK